MVDAGINPKRLTATGYGSSLPLVPNTSAENRAINRRIEFVLEKRALE
jgi:chemotaxis protein MotB